MRASLRLLPGLALVGCAAGHGSVVIPPPRNAVDRSLPPWKGGRFTPSGTIEPFGCVCTNASGICESAQSCFWFSQGCTIGCKTCSGNGSRAFNLDVCGSGMKATNNDPLHRTLNRNATAGSAADVYKYNPWRSPGNAPVFDPCGMAGGTTVPQIAGGEYRTTQFARQGDLGSRVLNPLPTGVVWTAGGLAETAFYIKANHGGGYQFRLCSREEALTEACFQRTPLPFGSPEQVLRFAGHEERIRATYVTDGTTPAGSAWAMNPISMCGTGLNVHTCGVSNQHTPDFPQPAPGVSNITSFIIVDTLRIPRSVPPGEYVLGWRWDSEQTSQVWSACSDVTIAAPR